MHSGLSTNNYLNAGRYFSVKLSLHNLSACVRPFIRGCAWAWRPRGPWRARWRGARWGRVCLMLCAVIGYRMSVLTMMLCAVIGYRMSVLTMMLCAAIGYRMCWGVR
jgi:hypothetical protein